MVRRIGLLIIFVLSPFVCFAAPSVSSVSSSLIHGNTVTISGSDFGTKSPAAPLMWDDCEGETNETAPSTSTANSSSQVAYSHVVPGAARNGDDVPLSHRTLYRNAPHTAVSTSIGGPHSHSDMYIAGGHYFCLTDCEGQYDGGLNGARDVAITVATPSGYAERWFATWYSRVDPSWPTTCGGDHNQKITCFQEGVQLYDDGLSHYIYLDLFIKTCSDAGYYTTKAAQSAAISGDYSEFPDTTPPWRYNLGDHYVPARVNSNFEGWTREEQRIANDTGFIHYLVDNNSGWWGTGNPDFFTGSGGTDLGYDGIRSFSVGGFYKYTNTPINAMQHSDAFRYFDDIYIDSTLSRVILANNATYASATILEPQPPTAWAAGEITVTVNQGAIPDGTAYLFVFDADNDANATGYTVTLVAANPHNISGAIISGGTIQ